MSVDKYSPHVYVLPEDDANRQLATGFRLGLSNKLRKMKVLEGAGGWQKVLDCFKEEHVPEMDRNAKRFLVLLMDFDEREDRTVKVRAAIPERLRERVFVLGIWSEPEKLRPTLGPYETIGGKLAAECRDNTRVSWDDPLLRHNVGELERLQKHVRPILFG
jgi:hypothetical protein